MTFEKLIRWTCNGCGKQVERSGYGLPKGWVFFKPAQSADLEPLHHHCEVCVQEKRPR